MAIEMVKVGSLPEEKIMIGRCSKCKSQYKAKKKDLDHECDYREHTYTCRCQLTGCSNLVYFNEERP